MVITVDVAKLVKNLQNAKEATPAELSDGACYLMKTVYDTLMADQPLTIGDIDFERFSHDEAWEFAGHIKNDVLEKNDVVANVHKLFSGYRPKINARRAFF